MPTKLNNQSILQILAPDYSYGMNPEQLADRYKANLGQIGGNMQLQGNAVNHFGPVNAFETGLRSLLKNWENQDLKKQYSSLERGAGEDVRRAYTNERPPVPEVSGPRVGSGAGNIAPDGSAATSSVAGNKPSPYGERYPNIPGTNDYAAPTHIAAFGGMWQEMQEMGLEPQSLGAKTAPRYKRNLQGQRVGRGLSEHSHGKAFDIKTNRDLTPDEVEYFSLKYGVKPLQYGKGQHVHWELRPGFNGGPGAGGPQNIAGGEPVQDAPVQTGGALDVPPQQAAANLPGGMQSGQALPSSVQDPVTGMGGGTGPVTYTGARPITTNSLPPKMPAYGRGLQQMPQQIPDQMPQQMPQQMPDQMPQQMPADRPRLSDGPLEQGSSEGGDDNIILAQAQGGQGYRRPPGPRTQGFGDYPFRETNPSADNFGRAMSNPFIDKDVKRGIIEEFKGQRQLQTLPVDGGGGKILFDPVTGKTKYIADPPTMKEVTIKGMKIPVEASRPNPFGPWEYSIYGEKVTPDSEGGTVRDGVIQRSGGGDPVKGIAERFGNIARDIEEKDKLMEGQVENEKTEKAEAIKVGRAADDFSKTLQIYKQVEQLPATSRINYGPIAPYINTLRTTLAGVLPEAAIDAIFNKDESTVGELLGNLSVQLAAKATRDSDPQPSVMQFNRYLSVTPGVLQTPNGRRALIFSMEHTMKRQQELAEAARTLTGKEYVNKSKQINEAYSKKNPIPPLVVADIMAGRNSKWLTERQWKDPKAYNDAVKIGESFFTPDGRWATRQR